MIDLSKVITLQEKVFSNGKWFLHKEQYCYEDIVEIMVNCSKDCKKEILRPVKHYHIILDGKDYYIPIDKGVKLNYLYPKEEIGIYNRMNYEHQHPTDFKKEALDKLGIDISYKVDVNENLYREATNFEDYGNCDIKKGRYHRRPKSKPKLPNQCDDCSS